MKGADCDHCVTAVTDTISIYISFSRSINLKIRQHDDIPTSPRECRLVYFLFAQLARFISLSRRPATLS